MPCRDSRKSARKSWLSIGIMAVTLVLLLMIPSLRASEDHIEQKPMKPRFERSSLLLTDNKTGLVWPLNANIGGRTFSWDDAQDFVVQLNLDKYAGFSDWKIPSLEEIESLISYMHSLGFVGGSEDRTVASGLRVLGIRSAQSDGYWTSTANIYYSAEAWYVNMTSGESSLGDKSLYFSLWPVRHAR